MHLFLSIAPELLKFGQLFGFQAQVFLAPERKAQIIHSQQQVVHSQLLTDTSSAYSQMDHLVYQRSKSAQQVDF